MEHILSIIADLLYRYGSNVAGSPSMHGTYEAPVPPQLRGEDAQ